MRRGMIWLLGMVLSTSWALAEDPGDWQTTVQGLLADYRDAASGAADGSALRETVSVADYAARNPRCLFPDPDLKGILGGMAFRFTTDGRFGLSFGPDFLQTYRKGSTAHWTVLAHELWHFRDYLRNPQTFVQSKKDVRESVLYEMDAIHVEADFVRLLADQKRQLTSFEQFVFGSYDHDYLASVVLMLHSESQRVIFFLNRHEKELGQGPIDGPAEIQALTQMGKALVDAYAKVDKAPEIEGFGAYVDLLTFRRQWAHFVPFVLRSPETTWGQVFETYPGLAELNATITAIETRDAALWADFRRHVVAAWEEEIRATPTEAS